MKPETIAILAGLAVGGYIGFSYAGRLQTYPPYAQILKLIRPPAVVQQAAQGASLGAQVGAAVSGAAGQLIGRGISDALSTLEGWFGGAGGSVDTSYNDDSSD